MFVPVPHGANKARRRLLLVEARLPSGGGHVARVPLLAHQTSELAGCGGLEIRTS